MLSLHVAIVPDNVLSSLLFLVGCSLIISNDVWRCWGTKIKISFISWIFFPDYGHTEFLRAYENP